MRQPKPITPATILAYLQDVSAKKDGVYPLKYNPRYVSYDRAEKAAVAFLQSIRYENF